ncbi:MAG TPA: ABC transporter permease [Candidatus Methylomirabilis sp.]|nr:ABC transporter permease [Candidatus Methylomirabilis sp.]
MGSLLQDLRHSCRMAVRNPGFTGIVLLLLAVGIASTATIFSVMYAVLLAPPLYLHADRLAVLWESNSAKGIARAPVAPATFRDWRESNRSFEDLELVAPGSPVTVTGFGLPERASIQYATPGLFALLGVRPALGRFFTDEQSKNANTVIVSYAFYERHFSGDLNSEEWHLIVNGTPQTVVGVLPKDFYLFDRDTDLWMAIDRPDAESQDRAFRSWLIAVGKLRPGVALGAAQEEMNLIAQRIAEDHPETNKNWGVKVEHIQEAQFGYWKPVLYLLFGIVVFVLLIASANVASLLLGRLASRSRELCVRASLGASRSRIAQQLLTEGLFLGGLGGLLGWYLTYWGIELFRLVAPADFPLLQSVHVNWPIFLFCLATSTLSGVSVSVSPALIASRINLNEALKTNAKTAVGQAHLRFQNALVAAEIALSLVLLFGAGLMMNSLVRLLRVDPGFRAQRVVTMQMFLAGPKYFEFRAEGVQIHPEVAAFYRQLLDRAKTLPGVESVGLVSWLPEMGYNTGRRERTFWIVGTPRNGGSDKPAAAFNAVSPDYFKALQIPFLRGRPFDSRDDDRSPWVAVVNDAFVQRYWPGENPIGNELLIDEGLPEHPRQVVGVVANVRQDALEKEPAPEIFVPYLQQPGITSAHGYQNRVHMTVVVRTSKNPSATIAAIRQIAAQMDESQPVYGIRTMSDVLSESTALRHLYAKLLELIAGIALFLSMIGIYGVLSHWVAQRANEIGLRMAVGAGSAAIRRLIFLQAGKLVAAGLAIGLTLALTLSRFLAAYLFGIGANDPATMVACCGVLLAAAAAAIWIPARRATRVDPMATLHYE